MLLCSVGSDPQHSLSVWLWQEKKMIAHSATTSSPVYTIRFNPNVSAGGSGSSSAAGAGAGAGGGAGGAAGAEYEFITCAADDIRFSPLPKSIRLPFCSFVLGDARFWTLNRTVLTCTKATVDISMLSEAEQKEGKVSSAA